MCIAFEFNVDWQENRQEIDAYKIVRVTMEGRLMSMREPRSRSPQTEREDVSGPYYQSAWRSNWQNGEKGVDIEYALGHMVISPIPGIYVRYTEHGQTAPVHLGRFLLVKGTVPKGAMFRKSKMTSSFCTTHFRPTEIVHDFATEMECF